MVKDSEALCERCKQPNGWRFLDKEHKHLCGPCSETGDAIFTQGQYRYGAVCSGNGCNTVGVVNYSGDGNDKFYCNGSPRCTP